MSMIDDKEIIKEKTNLAIGNITNKDVAVTYTSKREEGCIYDEGSYHFHLLPNDVKQFDEYSNKILEKRKELKNLLIEKIAEKNLGWVIETKGRGGNIVGLKQKTNGKYSSGGHLFSFIRIRYNGVFYDINFNRFYIDKGTVNCELYKPQFSCCKCNPGYPSSAKSGAYSYGTMYYNPEKTFADEDSELIEEFIDFVRVDAKKLLA